MQKTRERNSIRKVAPENGEMSFTYPLRFFSVEKRSVRGPHELIREILSIHVLA